MKVPYNDCIGVPQGAAISQALSNIYLKDIDDHLNENAIKNGDLYFRYVDDICYLSKNEDTITNTMKYLNDILESIGLRLNRKNKKLEKLCMDLII